MSYKNKHKIDDIVKVTLNGKYIGNGKVSNYWFDGIYSIVLDEPYNGCKYLDLEESEIENRTEAIDNLLDDE